MGGISPPSADVMRILLSLILTIASLFVILSKEYGALNGLAHMTLPSVDVKASENRATDYQL